jgi:single-stranded-DNA-specific exonuclease
VEHVEEFTRRFEQYVAENIQPTQTEPNLYIDEELSFGDCTMKLYNDLKRFEPFGPDNPKPLFATRHVYDFGTSRVVGRNQEHIRLELVDNYTSRVINGIAFGQSSQVRFIKSKSSFGIVYSVEENTHKRGEIQLQIEDIKPN